MTGKTQSSILNRSWSTLPFAALLVAAIFLFPQPAVAGPTDAIVACVEAAADEYAECWDSGGWIVKSLCTAKYAADGILCMGEVF